MLGADQEPYVVELSEHETAWPLAEALQALLADPELRARLGTKNRQQALQRYDLATMAAAHEAVWRSAL
jgi:glycosyltransferase involved in cell wall biosynthesis